MAIYLVRHGHAKPETEDPARPLSGRGRAEIERVAREATRLGVRVAEIRHSGLLRARQTAEILSAHLAPARGIRAVDGLGPNDDPEGIRSECEAAAEPVMLVGHLPHLGRLAALLLVGDPERELIQFEAGTLAALARIEGRWVVLHVLVPGPAPPGRP